MLIRIKTHSTWLFLNVVVSLGGCLFSSSSEEPAGYLVVGIESNPTQLDPRYSTDANSARIGALIFNSLLRADANLHLVPDLAESWAMVDARTYRFKLRKGVTFHNGKPLTAADVKYTYESTLDPDNQSPKRALLKLVETVDQPGPYEIVFRLKVPHAPFLEHCTLGIVPNGLTPARGASSAADLVGSGPFSLEELVSGEKVVLKANPSYWEGKPAIPGLVFKIIPDAMVRALEFKKGTIDFLQNDIEPDMLPWLRENTPAIIETLQGTTFQYLGMNLQHPILSQRKVRQALAHAIDREAVTHHVLKDLGTPASGVLSPLNWAYEPAVSRWPYDPQRAKELLDQAGFPDPDGDGPRFRFKLDFKTTTLDLRRRIAEAFKEQLRRVGIDLEIRTYEWGTFYSDIKKGNFHLYSLAWVGIMDPDVFYYLFHSNSIPPAGDNRGRYANSEMDRLLEQGRATLDPRARRVVYSRIQKILADDLPYIPLWWVTNVVILNPAVQGFVPYPDGELISLKRVSLSSGRPGA